MAQAPVGADFHQAADIAKNFTSKVAFDLIGFVNDLAEVANFMLCKFAHFLARVNSSLGNDFGGILLADAVNKRQGVQNRLISWKVYTSNTGH